MAETNEYILESIRSWVWSGYYSPEEVQEMIDDILEEDADETLLRAAVDPEFQKKAEDETTWPDETDCDRLDAAFESLTQNGVLALQNAGYTMSDGHDDAAEALKEHDPGTFTGYCFFHGQDLARAVRGDGLMIAFDHVDGDVPQKVDIGEQVKAALERFGFTVEWDGTINRRIDIPKIDWKRRRTR